MSLSEASSSAEAIKAAADRAMMNGDPRGGAELFERACALAPDWVEPWLGLAACRRALGEREAALGALDRALAADPRCFPALLMRGSLLESLGQAKPAAVTYGDVLKIAPPDETLGEPARRALAHARDVHTRYAAELAAALKADIGLTDGATSVEARRILTFIEAMAGRRKIYHQEPARFHYPGLPAIEFFERDEFPWLEAFETAAPAIREELLAVWAEGSPELEPYIDYPDGLPLDQWAELNRSLRWSAYYHYYNGELVETHASACPATMAALEGIGQPRIARRSPSSMFSILRPRTRIPPHTGVANTRLVVHLPLVVPADCGFRVGGDTRQWREGEAWVFDDTIEHEAWNDSPLPRAILICDVWNPRLPPAERDMVAQLMAALDRFTGEKTEAGL
jgi:aspartyl/asparaginyl beta-hydroxylase (cupin superfamily)